MKCKVRDGDFGCPELQISALVTLSSSLESMGTYIDKTSF